MPERTLVCQSGGREVGDRTLARADYNTVRPHRSLNGATPQQFARIAEGARRLTPARPDKENEARKPEDLTLSV
jgi:hypothetical protein